MHRFNIKGSVDNEGIVTELRISSFRGRSRESNAKYCLSISSYGE
jgi:hypothetical protein